MTSAEIHLLRRLVSNERSARHRGSVLQRWWPVFLPAVESGALAFVFAFLLGTSGATGHLPLLILVGVPAWRVFARAVSASTGALPRNAALLHTFPVPACTVLLASATSAMLDGLLAAPLILALLKVFGPATDILVMTGWVAVGIALQVSVTLGLALLLGVAGAFYRDVRLALGPALTVLMFAAPVVYPVALVPDAFQFAYLLNPISAAIESYRAGLLGTAPVPPGALAGAAVVAGATLCLGVLASRRLDPRLREVL